MKVITVSIRTALFTVLPAQAVQKMRSHLRIPVKLQEKKLKVPEIMQKATENRQIPPENRLLKHSKKMSRLRKLKNLQKFRNFNRHLS